jgi:hypothetical protein
MLFGIKAIILSQWLSGQLFRQLEYFIYFSLAEYAANIMWVNYGKWYIT